MTYAQALGIEYRVVEEAEHEGERVRVVSGARVYNTPVDDVWDAVTNPARIPRWFLPISGTFEVGGRYQLEGNAGGIVTRCDPPRALDVTWEHGGNVRWVTVRLEAVGESTRLTLRHLMSKDDESEAHWKTYGPGATGVGWELSFYGLGLHLDDGSSPSEDSEWEASEEGKAFIKHTATAWGEVHVRAGEDESAARCMAETTAAFYCGETTQ